MAYVLIKFANSPRPDLWVLERSTDFGQTYQPWHFFACEFPGRGWRGASPGVGCRHQALSGSPRARLAPVFTSRTRLGVGPELPKADAC